MLTIEHSHQYYKYTQYIFMRLINEILCEAPKLKSRISKFKNNDIYYEDDSEYLQLRGMLEGYLWILNKCFTYSNITGKKTSIQVLFKGDITGDFYKEMHNLQEDVYKKIICIDIEELDSLYNEYLNICKDWIKDASFSSGFVTIDTGREEGLIIAVTKSMTFISTSKKMRSEASNVCNMLDIKSVDMFQTVYDNLVKMYKSGEIVVLDWVKDR